MLSTIFIVILSLIFAFIIYNDVVYSKNRKLVYIFFKYLTLIFFTYSIAWFYFLVVGTYDIHHNSKKTCSKFIQLIEENNFKRSYKFFNKYAQNAYTFDEFSNLIKKIKVENTSLNYECTRVTSGDNFNLILTDLNDVVVLVVSFGGGYGFGWKVTNIRNEL